VTPAARVLLAFDRETLMVSALVALAIAGVIVSFTAWMLLARERRSGRMTEAGSDENEPTTTAEAAEPPAAAR
jgi:hypothetical protein